MHQNTTLIDFPYYNKKTFEVDETIKIVSQIKNVTKLVVKVFEINLDNYYRKNMNAFKTDINLDGLIAKFEKEFQYADKPANQKHFENFEFDQFNGKRGLWVMEFVGNGVSSRAIVQKGNMTFIQKMTIAGHFIFILNEKREICKGLNTGLYYDNRFYKTDDNGRIILPFARSQSTQKMLLMHEGFTTITEMSR